MTCVIPSAIHDDERITPIMAQLMQRVNSHIGQHPQLSLQPVPGSEIGLECHRPVFLPCIAVSRLGSDISAAINKANIGQCLGLYTFIITKYFFYMQHLSQP